MHVFAGLLFAGLAETLNKVIFRNSTLNYYKSLPDSLLPLALWLSAFLFNGLFLHPSVMNRILFPEKLLLLSSTTNRLRFDLFYFFPSPSFPNLDSKVSGPLNKLFPVALERVPSKLFVGFRRINGFYLHRWLTIIVLNIHYHKKVTIHQFQIYLNSPFFRLSLPRLGSLVKFLRRLPSIYITISISSTALLAEKGKSSGHQGGSFDEGFYYTIFLFSIYFGPRWVGVAKNIFISGVEDSVRNWLPKVA